MIRVSSNNVVPELLTMDGAYGGVGVWVIVAVDVFNTIGVGVWATNSVIVGDGNLPAIWFVGVLESPVWLLIAGIILGSTTKT